MRKRWGLWTVVVLVAAAILGVIFRAPIGRALAAAVIDLATGYQVAFDSLDVGTGHVVADGVVVRRGGDPVMTARHLAIAYDLGEFLHGTRQYGLHRVELDEPVLTLVRHADGGFNVGRLSPSGGGGAQPAGPSANPLRLAAKIVDGSVVVIDPYRTWPGSRRIELAHVAADANVDSTASSRYSVRGALSTAGAPGASSAFDVDGRSEAKRGYAMSRLSVASVPVRDLVNYIVNSQTASMQAGTARNLVVRAYALDLGSPNSQGLHLTGSVELTDGEMTLPGVRRPLRAMNGKLDVYDGGIAAPHVRATIADLPVKVTGAIYGWSAPQFRLAATTAGSLAQVRSLFTFAQRLPLDGPLFANVAVVGPVSDPLVATRFVAPSARYARYPLHDVHGLAIYQGSSVVLAPLDAGYGPIAVDARGTLDLGATAASDLLINANAPPATLPYMAQAVPGAPLHATGLVEGDDLQVQARGVFDGAGRGDEVAGFFDVDRRGDGIIGPLHASRADGSALEGAYFLNRAQSESGFWIDARNFDFALVASRPSLPGIPTLAPPQFSGRVTAALVGIGPPSNFAVAGALDGSDVQVGALRVDSVSASLAGSPNNARLARVRATGPWGDFAGRGSVVEGALALDGDYRGSFERLTPLTGDLGAHGPLNGPLALVVAQNRIIVQSSGAETPGAIVHGLPLDRLQGTLAVEGQKVDILAATASFAGGTVTAAGTLAPGQSVNVSVAGIDAGRLRSTGVPLSSGSVIAIGDVTERNGLPTFSGGVALGDGRLDAAHVRGLGISGSGDVVADSKLIRLSDTQTLIGSAYGVVDGTVGSLGTTPQYDLNVHARDVPIGPFARIIYPRRNDIDGTLNSDVAVAGSGSGLPRVSGAISVPEGTFNGQAFRDARAQLDVAQRTVVARSGTLVVGSTSVGFGARLSGPDTYLRLSVPHANLEDFDDLFDTGDTLGGTGQVTGTFEKHGASVKTVANVAISNFRYKRYELGDSTARWSSRGPRVDAHVAFGGASGRLETNGTVTLPARAPFDKLLQRSSFDGTAQLSALDLGVWLPALGYKVPVVGRVDANATIRGLLMSPGVTADAALTHGTIGKLPIDRAVLSFTADRRTIAIRNAELAIPSLALNVAGTFGIGNRDPLALSLHAKTDNLGSLAGKFIAIPMALTGTAEADVKVAGTRAQPHVTGGLDIEQAALGGVAIPRALGQFEVKGRDVVISGTELNFAKGSLLLAGSVPFTLSPFALGPPQASIALDVSANGIDLTDFAPLLPHDSTLLGKLDGHIAVGGTAGNPHLAGDLSLGSGTLQSPYETIALTNIASHLTFDGNTVSLTSLHAEGGGGTLDAAGSAIVPDLVHPGADATYALHGTAKALRLDLPTYGSGVVDGTLSLTHSPGALASLEGNMTVQDGVIPFSALLLASQLGGTGGPQFPTPGAPVQPPAGTRVPDANLAFTVTAGNNMRVRSGSVDLGGRGSLAIGGTVHAPTLTGGFASTGGTLTYFNTVFRVESGTVTFSPDQGLIPSLDALATTHVINPDPNTLRNATGTADITVNVTGPVNALNISLSSDPAYDREQILGLLLSAPVIGADIFASQTPGPGQPFGSVSQNRYTAQTTVGEEAFGIINAQFTRNLLSPIETAFGGALGLSNLAFNIDYTGGVGLSARKILGKTVDVIYATSFTYPYRQTFGFNLKPNATTAAQVTVFESLGSYYFGIANPSFYPGQPTNQRATAAQPSTGTVGFSFSLQRLYP